MRNLKEEDVVRIMDILAKEYPDARCGLKHSTPFELLISTILSAQCTDTRVNAVTSKLFLSYGKPGDLIALGEEKLGELIRECGLYRVKSRNIIKACKKIILEYGGKVPSSFDELVKIPGVGRKTANVVLSNAFNIPAIAVDTHVFRVSNRIGLASGKTPESTEKDLREIIPRDKWSETHHLLIRHGRKICSARKPPCEICKLRELCMHYKKNHG